MAASILIVDDEPNITLSFSSLLKDEGYETAITETAEAAVEKCARRSFDLIVLDLQLPGMSGIDFLRQLKGESWPPVVLVVSGQADIPMALDAVRLGAADFLEKPVPPEKLIASVRACLALVTANRQRAVQVGEMEETCRILGESKAISSLTATIADVAPTDTTVLVTGENGTGKELVATQVYLGSNRRQSPFVKVNCPGIPETLFESELFGHMKGSFTGSVRDYPGKFALADGGTMFLDEIGDLPLPCQAKLLRALETGEIETLGSDTRRKVDVRIICATNHDLERLVADGRFRADLYYRISVFEIHVPSLAERAEDIPLLVGDFLRRYDPTGATQLSASALAYLSSLDWPGNVRQLKNLIERLTIQYRGQRIEPDDLAADPRGSVLASAASRSSGSLSEQVSAYERQLIAGTLRESRGNISQAARKLKVDRAHLSKKVKEYGLKNS
ncbi:MAG: sigma-54-dependent Fis family transcriptional regulator [Candidatus Zixiibacteriota bacterium]|nr:MAG: sigma-54-dependent Fis family transcriptional regulator [candidate division Zixibacteria bacterium]